MVSYISIPTRSQRRARSQNTAPSEPAMSPPANSDPEPEEEVEFQDAREHQEHDQLEAPTRPGTPLVEAVPVQRAPTLRRVSTVLPRRAITAGPSIEQDENPDSDMESDADLDQEGIEAFEPIIFVPHPALIRVPNVRPSTVNWPPRPRRNDNPTVRRYLARLRAPETLVKARMDLFTSMYNRMKALAKEERTPARIRLFFNTEALSRRMTSNGTLDPGSHDVVSGAVRPDRNARFRRLHAGNDPEARRMQRQHVGERGNSRLSVPTRMVRALMDHNASQRYAAATDSQNQQSSDAQQTPQTVVAQVANNSSTETSRTTTGPRTSFEGYTPRLRGGGGEPTRLRKGDSKPTAPENPNRISVRDYWRNKATRQINNTRTARTSFRIEEVDEEDDDDDEAASLSYHRILAQMDKRSNET